MTSLKILSFSILVLSLWSCENNLESVSVTNELGYTESFQRDKNNFAREGWSSTTDAKGLLMEKAHYLHDTLDGIRILFYENGDTNIIETYRKGLFEGPYKFYYEGGQLKQFGQYVNNEMAGDWLLYYENGQLKEKVRFMHNQEDGPFIEYHANGKIATEGQYADGDNEDGELKIYDEDGILSRIMQCDRGRCKTTWSVEDQNLKKEKE